MRRKAGRMNRRACQHRSKKCPTYIQINPLALLHECHELSATSNICKIIHGTIRAPFCYRYAHDPLILMGAHPILLIGNLPLTVSLPLIGGLRLIGRLPGIGCLSVIFILLLIGCLYVIGMLLLIGRLFTCSRV